MDIVVVGRKRCRTMTVAGRYEALTRHRGGASVAVTERSICSGEGDDPPEMKLGKRERTERGKEEERRRGGRDFQKRDGKKRRNFTPILFARRVRCRCLFL